MAFVRFESNWQAIETEAEAFFLRISGPGDYRYKGADLGILIDPGAVDDRGLPATDRALSWIRAIRRGFAASNVPTETPVASVLAATPTKGFGYRQVLS